MKQISALAFAAVLALFIAASFSFGAGRADDEVSPIIGVIPTRYRQWELIAPAQEAEPLNELRSVLGNPDAATHRYSVPSGRRRPERL